MLELAKNNNNNNPSLQINSCRINMPLTNQLTTTLWALATEVDMNTISISPIAIPKT